VNDLLRALSLLTILPVRPRWDGEAPLGRAMAFYPLVGLGIGGLLAGGATILDRLDKEPNFPSLRATLLLVAWVAITGGLHLDGWGDACDALLPVVDRERRLEILRDPRMGSFGVIGITLLLLVKLAGLQAIHDGAPLILAPTLGRWVIVLAAAGWPSARPGGMGDRFRQGLQRRHIAWATLTTLAAVAWFQCDGVIALMVALMAGGALAYFAVSRLGGLTGDIYGALVEGVEASVLVTLALV